MKLAVTILTLLISASFAAQAQTKMELAPESGRGKYTEVEPISLKPETNHKKVRLQANARKVEPVAHPAQNEVQLIQETKPRVEGRLADNYDQESAVPMPAFR